MLTIFAVTVVYALFLLSRIPANKSNHFSRQLPPHVLIEKGGLSWQPNPWHLAGNDDSSFFLSHRQFLNVVMRVGKNKLDTTVSTIRLKNNMDQKFSSAALLLIDSGMFYLTDGKTGQIYRGNTVMWNAKLMDTNMPFFDKTVVLNENVYSRSIQPPHGFVLGERNTTTGKQAYFSDLLERQVDGFFDKDGTLLKDSYHNYIIYLYRYRNQFLVMDTAMRLLYKGKTIDTVTHVRLKLGSTDQGKETKMATPPPTVNQSACTANGYLFINSALRADNEQVDLTKEASVIDVYDLKNGDYRFSFYISNSNNEKTQQFLISGNLLAVMYPHQLKIFQLAGKYFNH
ncbi:MAG TPA: hypothetical protein VGN00_12680 [Puia sp.]